MDRRGESGTVADRIRRLFVRPTMQTQESRSKHATRESSPIHLFAGSRNSNSPNSRFRACLRERRNNRYFSDCHLHISSPDTSRLSARAAASPMSPNEEMTQASRPKRPAAATAVSSAAAAAGTRLRRPAPSKVRAEKSRPKETLCLRDLQRGGQRGDGASVRAARSSPAVQTRVNRRGSIPRTRLDGFPARSRL